MSWPQTRNPGRPERQAKKKLSPLWHFHSADFVRTRSQDFHFPPLCTCSRFSDSCCCLSTFLFCFRHSSLGKVNKNKALSVGVSVCPCVCVCVCVSGRQHSKTSDCCQKMLHASGILTDMRVFPRILCSRFQLDSG